MIRRMFVALGDIPGFVVHGLILAAGLLVYFVVDSLPLRRDDHPPRHGDDFHPWMEHHQAVVYWDAGHTAAMRAGFESTAELLGVDFRHTDDIDEANLRVWIDRRRFKYGGLGGVWGRAQEEWPSTPHGIEAGDIYLFPTSWGLRRFCPVDRINDYSLMAHETAHLLAGVGHFGAGLMVAGPEYRGRKWFTVEDILYMQRHVGDFRRTRPVGQESV